MTNAERVERAQGALAGYDLLDEGQDAVTDLLTDLRHLCDVEGFDFDAAVRSSEMHHEAEVTDDE